MVFFSHCEDSLMSPTMAGGLIEVVVNAIHENCRAVNQVRFQLISITVFAETICEMSLLVMSQDFFLRFARFYSHQIK